MGEAKRRRNTGYDPRTTSAQDRAALDFIHSPAGPNPFLSEAEKRADRFFAGENVPLDPETRDAIEQRMPPVRQSFKL